MKTSASNYGIILLIMFLISMVYFGLTLFSLLFVFLSGYFFGVSSPESNLNAEYAKIMSGSNPYMSYQSEFPSLLEHDLPVHELYLEEE
jgi:hypothetical protein